ncbi:hypothetical protein BDW68DRAFT_153790 [Aspergillus falconensis]
MTQWDAEANQSVSRKTNEQVTRWKLRTRVLRLSWRAVFPVLPRICPLIGMLLSLRRDGGLRWWLFLSAY